MSEAFAQVEAKIAAIFAQIRRKEYAAILSSVTFESGPFQDYTYQGVLNGIIDGLTRHPEFIEQIAQQVDQLIRESNPNETPVIAETPPSEAAPSTEAAETEAPAAGAGGAQPVAPVLGGE